MPRIYCLNRSKLNGVPTYVFENVLLSLLIRPYIGKSRTVSDTQETSPITYRVPIVQGGPGWEGGGGGSPCRMSNLKKA